MSLLEVDALSLRIGQVDVLRDVSFSVQAGEILALIGESGSGKSMTALSVMNLLPRGARTSGCIRLSGQDLLQTSERDLCGLRGRTMSMVFQEPMTALNPVQTIGAQVAESFSLHQGLSRWLSLGRAAEALERVGLPPDRFPLSRYPHELSGGQRQRVVIAIALAQRPKLLIADEPTTALDVTTQAQILELLRRLVREDGTGLILVTHDLAIASGFADRIAVMKHGRIVETGATADVLQNRRNAYTAKLLAAATHRVDMPPAMHHEPLLVAEDVTRRYKVRGRGRFAVRTSVEAVRNLSFTLHRGERLGLVGESGCGKSTLARALLGLESIDGGHISLAGQTIAPGSAARPRYNRRLQVVFQDPYGSFNPRHHVARLVAEPFHLAVDPPRGSARDEAVADALSAVGLDPRDAGRYIHEFSGGQRQRIAIARALITRPDVILFDEAVSALDVSVRAQILDLLADLCRGYNLSYLFISHDLAVVRSVTDRVLVMRAGEIVESGPSEQVFTDPQHPYTKMLVAAAPRLPETA